MKNSIEWYDVIGRIKNKREYKAQYYLMNFFAKSSDDFVIASKKRMREYTHSDNTKFVFDGKYEITSYCVKDCGIDGFVELVYLPKECKTYEDANEFFDKYLYQERPNSMYDCTGISFTSWYHIFKRNGRYCVYHKISVDV